MNIFRIFKKKISLNDTNINIKEAYKIFEDFDLTSKVTYADWEDAIAQLIMLRRDFEYLNKGKIIQHEKGEVNEKEYKKVLLNVIQSMDRKDISDIIWDFLIENSLAHSYNDSYQPEFVLYGLKKHFYPNLTFSVKSAFNKEQWSWTIEGKIHGIEIKDWVVSRDRPIDIIKKAQEIVGKNDSLEFKFVQSSGEPLIKIATVPKKNFKRIINNKYLFILPPIT